MIVGIGLDVTELDRITKAYERRKKFAERILTIKEHALFSNMNGTRQEAFSKALGTGIGKLSFQDMEVLPDSKGKPIVTKSPFDGKIWVSISHSSNIIIAQVILEK